MARPRTDHQLPETRDRLLDAALIQFAAGGFAGTRLDDIAEDAGLRRSSLLYHFPTKDHLYTAVVRRAFSALAAELEAAMAAPGSFPEQVANLERRYLDFVTARPEFATLILREILDGHGPGRGLLLDQVVPLPFPLGNSSLDQPDWTLQVGQPVSIRWSPAPDLADLRVKVGYTLANVTPSAGWGIDAAAITITGDTINFTVPDDDRMGPGTLTVSVEGIRALATHTIQLSPRVDQDATYVP